LTQFIKIDKNSFLVFQNVSILNKHCSFKLYNYWENKRFNVIRYSKVWFSM